MPNEHKGPILASQSRLALVNFILDTSKTKNDKMRLASKSFELGPLARWRCYL